MLAGRGFGKTRSGAEYVQEMARLGRARHIALVAPIASDARDVMVEGESGILSIAPDSFRPKYEPSKRRLTWPNGAMATTYSADEPERLRGPQHDLAWADEIASWRYPEAWDMLMFGLRKGEAKAVVTTTPKPVKVLRELIELSSTVVVKGSSYENRDNLAPAFFDKIIRKYEGTRLGRQELYAELLDDVPGALWVRTDIETSRVADCPDLLRIVVAVDPEATSTEESSETGIIVAGKGEDGHGYILEDLTIRETPDRWARVVVGAYHKWQADRVVAETNQGGEMVEAVIRTVDVNIPYKGVHASRGKVARAEPIAALYEQGRVHHVGTFELLEDQCCTYVPGEKSPDRMDALVWALTELQIENEYVESVVTQPGWTPGGGGY